MVGDAVDGGSGVRVIRRRPRPIDHVSGPPEGTLGDVPVWVCLRDGALLCLRCERTGPVDRRRLSALRLASALRKLGVRIDAVALVLEIPAREVTMTN